MKQSELDKVFIQLLEKENIDPTLWKEENPIADFVSFLTEVMTDPKIDIELIYENQQVLLVLLLVLAKTISDEFNEVEEFEFTPRIMNVVKNYSTMFIPFLTNIEEVVKQARSIEELKKCLNSYNGKKMLPENIKIYEGIITIQKKLRKKYNVGHHASLTNATRLYFKNKKERKNKKEIKSITESVSRYIKNKNPL
ncbi:MAG: hypothetical protein V3V16_15820 [Melioribacteraceae bacterium]